jgi:hypothetical protein
MTRFLTTCFILFLALGTQAQQRTCAAMEVLQNQLQSDPAMMQRMEEIERHTQIFASTPQTQQRAVITIPVVFHVVYKSAAENISDAQLQSQIDVLNRDFHKLNADVTKVPAAFTGLVADAEVQFCLAKRTVSGAATTGIERLASTRTTAFGTADAVKSVSTGGMAAWDATKYLNLWICDIGGGILGYAQFPGGAAATDGVVIDYHYCGVTTTNAPYNLGRTATHEVGHWLNLRHIWGDASCGNDLVTDTPTQSTANYGCPTYPHVTCTNGASGDMFMNYMDYTDDGCMYMFSTGQKTRMQALFATGGSRIGLATSQGCVPVSTTCSVPTGFSASGLTSTGATLSWTAVGAATSYQVDYHLVGAATWTTLTTSGTSTAIAGPLARLPTVQLLHSPQQPLRLVVCQQDWLLLV